MVQNLKDLEKLLKLCRRQGVTEINLGAVSFKLGDLPIEISKQSQNLSDDLTQEPDPFMGMTEKEIDDMVFYSAPQVENGPDEAKQ
jgi:hypothetical protein